MFIINFFQNENVFFILMNKNFIIRYIIFLYKNIILYFKFMINKKRNFDEIYFLFTNHIKLIKKFSQCFVSRDSFNCSNNDFINSSSS